MSGSLGPNPKAIYPKARSLKIASELRFTDEVGDSVEKCQRQLRKLQNKPSLGVVFIFDKNVVATMPEAF